MKPLCYAIACCLATAPVAAAPAPLPRISTYKTKILGPWRSVKLNSRNRSVAITMEFTGDGKYTARGVFNSRDFQFEGTYTVKGDKLELTTKYRNGKERKATHTITKLTNTELHYRTEKGSTVEFRRTKK